MSVLRIDLNLFRLGLEKSKLSDGRLFQIFATRAAKNVCLTLVLQEGKNS